MGLAASQARLLMLTSRKSDVEGKLMNIAMQKLSLSRQSSEASEKYADAMNSTTKSLTVDNIAYSDVMTYISGASSQYALTDKSGAVMLSAADAAKFGLTGSSGAAGQLSTDTSAMASKFSSLTGITDTAAIKKYLEGGAASGTSSTNTAGSKTLPKYDEASVLSNKIKIDGNESSLSTWFNRTKGDAFYLSDYDGDQKKISLSGVQSNFESLLDVISNSLQAGLEAQMGQSLDAYIETARRATLLQFLGGDDVFAKTGNYKTGSDWVSSAKTGSDYAQANGTNRIWFDVKGNSCDSNGGEDSGRYTVDVGQVIKTFLNFFDIAFAEGLVTDSGAPTKAGTDLYNSKYTYAAKYGMSFSDSVNGTTGTSRPTVTGSRTSTGSGTSATLTDTQKSQLNWYINLYNAINANGWVTNSSLSSSADALKNAILNGDVYIKSIGTKGALTNVTSSFEKEEEDDDAIEKAKSDFEADKDKLDYKESLLDVQQNNLDTELSAIQTEMESVQKLIDNNVKIFKMFDS